MAAVVFQLLHLFLILEVGYWAKAAAEDRRGDAQESAEHRSPVRGSASRVSAVSASMFRLYEQYSKEPHRQRDANTVRSFKAVPGVSETGEWFQFNLSSIQDSEHILSASFHFLHKRPRHQRPSVSCRPRNPSCTFQRQQQPPSLALLFHGASRGSAPTPLLGNATVAPFKRGLWQAMDITSVVEQARALNEFLIHVEFDSGSPPSHEGLSSSNLPYILAYADDQAIDDPNSVALSLQRYSPFPLGEDPARSRDAPAPPAPPLLSASRARRELPRFPAGQIQTNDLPEVHFNTLKNHELWQSTYFPPKAKAVVRHGRKQGLEGGGSPGKPQVLSFDERTMKKARRRQWNEPRVCARRYLRVDFADIGWNEWVVAPKAFDAYYCSGTCGFPIPRVVRPSNHATIQSIVRAVGIVPGVPEPCCVPDQMSPLPVLFLDPNRNIVLKVYPAMSVDTCTCR